MWMQVKALAPSIVGYWVALCCIASVGWYAWTRVHRQFKFVWTVPLLVATVFWSYSTCTNLVSLYQNGVLYSVQQQGQTQAQPQPGSAAQSSVAPEDPMTRMKQDFLNSIQTVIKNPEAANKDFREKFFAQFEKLVPRDKAGRQAFAKPILDIIQCQRYFWEDALASYKAHKPIKSDSREECEKMPGQFFNRETLLPPDIVKKNQELIATFAKHGKVPGPEGRLVEPQESFMREAYDSESSAHEAVRRLFAD